MSKLELKLPPALIGRAHLSQLVRELENVENDFERQKAHGKTKSELKMPTMSRALTDCVELNAIDMSSGQARAQFKASLGGMKEKAPTMHFTFATEPDGESLQRLTDWIRQEIHPQALVSVGLQPALVGGAYLRTPNHVHDFSLRRMLHDKRGLITEAMEQYRPEKPAAPAEPLAVPGKMAAANHVAATVTVEAKA